MKTPVTMINLNLWQLWFVGRVKFEDFLFLEFFDISSHLGDVLGTQSNYDPPETEVYLKTITKTSFCLGSCQVSLRSQVIQAEKRNA